MKMNRLVCLIVIFASLSRSAVIKDEVKDLVDNSVDVGDDSEAQLIDLSHFGNQLYGIPSEEAGEALAKWTEEDKTNPEELGGYLEGDILVPRPAGRNGIRTKSARWPKGVIPFEIRGNFNAREMDLIERALNDYKSKTCLKFVPRTNQKDYISIQSGSTGCWSSVGRIGGQQVVNLQAPGCVTKKGTVIHELMHAAGFTHEQNRAERDSHVTINWANIRSGVQNNFEKVKDSEYSGFGVPYDYRSVMHYSANAFSINGQPTIIAKSSKDGSLMGQREGFSSGDLRKIRSMYNCRGL